ncbi:hypothetical protein [Agromyces silvae]|uniref:hypothetical protein n=1 Tax=Agromyces silvae TaxID=3388266 RepID=UPI00280BAD93|nr:hypothetical protein [Agromyces protaetiae]
MIELTEPQIWTVIGAFTTLMVGMITIVSMAFVRAVHAESRIVQAEIRGVREEIKGVSSRIDGLDRDVQALVKRTFGLDRG